MEFAGYELSGEIGRGASGVVYRARARDGREVALKVLLRTDGGFLARFEREKRILAMLGEAHGFVPVYDSGGPPAAKHPFVVMPLLGGGSLRERLQRGPLGVLETLELGERLARALAVAHERGLVHLDLNRGWARLRKDDLEGAVADLSRALELDPKADLAQSNRAVARCAKKDWRGALDDANAVIERSPNLEEPWLSRAQARDHLGDVKGAVADYERYARAASDDPRAGRARERAAQLRAASR